MNTFYTLVIDDNGTPTIKPVEIVGTANIGGALYWLIPATEPEPRPGTEPEPRPDTVRLRSDEPEWVTAAEQPPEPTTPETLHRLVLAALDAGMPSVSQIARAAGCSTHIANKIIRDAAIPTPGDKLRYRFQEVLRQAGDQGVPPTTLGHIAIEVGQRAGPILKSMLFNNTVRRLRNGYWCLN